MLVWDGLSCFEMEKLHISQFCSFLLPFEGANDAYYHYKSEGEICLKKLLFSSHSVIPRSSAQISRVILTLGNQLFGVSTDLISMLEIRKSY